MCLEQKVKYKYALSFWAKKSKIYIKNIALKNAPWNLSMNILIVKIKW